MVTLPHALGVPAVGIDPTAEELQQIGDVAVSSRGSVLVSRCVLGGGQPRLRDLVYVLADLWQATARDLQILSGCRPASLTRTGPHEHNPHHNLSTERGRNEPSWW